MHKTSLDNKNKYLLHIPRVSLSPISTSCSGSGSSSKSSSRSREFSPNPIENNFKISEMENEGYRNSWMDERKSHNDVDNGKISRKANHPMYIVYKAGKPQNKFNSSQSSSSSSSAASNQSNYSVNTLLLSVKNLENFNRNAENVKSINENKRFNNIRSDNVYRKQMLSNLKNIVTIDRPEMKNNQKKEPDQLSTASSATNTNFTVITFNGFGKNNRKKSRSICRRRHQVTLLIIIMTFLLFVGIFAAICAIEMRYQKMPR
ncbi:hypothetical protein PVAND_009939 [Polypedilum vanderplanki]|uniref:Uncharacterized protein n=1 Tax=Polypedilum vanderplanki TaxID=319348 RepID=A0A9J6CET2_POLVA|nr:hypothetical protein PVAND_009939 [Polypedilum vanderplanki]